MDQLLARLLEIMNQIPSEIFSGVKMYRKAYFNQEVKAETEMLELIKPNCH